MNGWPEGYGLRVLDMVDSTMDEATRIAQGLEGPEWILAHAQTAGRGRRGRRWKDVAGNLSASLVMRPGEAPAEAALRSFVAALALFDACATAMGRAEGLALKWPNDLLLNGGKLAGILLEGTGQGAAMSHLAIGFGVNLVTAPALEDQGAGATPVSLQGETGVKIAPRAFLDLLAPAYAAREAMFRKAGFAPIREAWLARAARLGAQITARTLLETWRGRFETVDDAGNLVLSTPDGRRSIAAAEVFF